MENYITFREFYRRLLESYALTPEDARALLIRILRTIQEQKEKSGN